VQAELEKTFPPRLAPLAGPAAGALHQLAPQVAQRAMATPQFESLWSNANRAAHETLLKIVDGGGSTVSTNGGEVTLNLNSLLTQIGGQLGGKLASKLPANAGQLTILKSSQLSAAQEIASLVRKLPIVLTLLAFLLYVLAIYLAGPRRREALRGVGFSFIVAGVLVLALRHFGGSAVTGALAKSDAVKPAAEAVWSIATSLLVTVAVSALTFGILLVIGAWLAGPTRLATALRREAAPYLRERRGTTYAVVGFIFLALILWAPVVAFHKPIGLLLLAVLMVLGTEALRRQAVAEFPDATFGGLGDRVRASVPGRAAAEPQALAGESKLEQIERLSALKDKGALSEEEFEAAKAEVLGP
jgi:Short C-terminal domain